MLLALAKNIVVNFMERFFKGEGRALVRREVERMKPQVIVCALFFANLLYYEKPADYWLASFSSRPRLIVLMINSVSMWRKFPRWLIMWRNHPKLLGPGALIFVAKQL